MAYDNDNIFAKILRGEMPAFSVYETAHCLAFLDIMPQSDGHTLVLPKTPAENLFDLDEEAARQLFAEVKIVATGVKKAFSPDGIRLMQFNGAAAGQTVFHFHMHIVPCYEGQGQGQRSHAGETADSALLEEQAARLRAALI